jgi:hypothetical protein
MPVVIEGHTIDCAVVEEHTDENVVTRNPVESGVAMTDHIRRMPRRVVIEGIVSDTPLGAVADLREAEGTATPSIDAREYLALLSDNREPVQVRTEIRVYESMALVSLVETRDGKTGHAMRFRATFEGIDIVTNDRATVRVAVPRAQRKRSLGHKAAPEATAWATTEAKAAGMYRRNRSTLDRIVN